MSNEGGVVVHVESDEASARIVIGFLGSQGIEAQISEDDAGDQIPSLESTGGVKVLVPAEDADRARRLLQERGAETEGDGE